MSCKLLPQTKNSVNFEKTQRSEKSNPLGPKNKILESLNPRIDRTQGYKTYVSHTSYYDRT